ncbi:MAG TPA: hypothetical protein VFN96_04905 [Gemmatimonadales bacterium]|nr:hypothetical protein [Gemmatimonadales bacterium]
MQSRLASLEPPAPCARCEARTPGLKWGDICHECRAELRRRAAPWARRISLLAALAVVAYAYVGLTLRSSGRFWVVAIAAGTYFLTLKIVSDVAVEYLRGRAPRFPQ